MTHTVPVRPASPPAVGPLPLSDVLELGLAVAAELRRYHERGESHGAVAPPQIYFGVEGPGLAPDHGQKQPACYLAPELLCGCAADPLSDIFAFGVLLFQAATGQSPFPGPDEKSVRNAVLHTEPPAVSSLLPSLTVEEIPLYRTLNGLVQRCLAKSRPARVQRIQKAQSELRVLACSAGRLRMMRRRQVGVVAPPPKVPTPEPEAVDRLPAVPDVAPPLGVAPPRLRSDLTVRQQRSSAGTFFIIKDPVSGAFFRLREAEGFIVRQLNGDTPLDEVRARVQERFGAELSPQTLQGFIANLEKGGLLETGSRKGRVGGGRRLAGSILYLRYRLLDPTRLFDRLAPWVAIFYTPYFVLLSSFSIMSAAGVVWSNSAVMVQELSRLLTPSIAVLFVVISCATVSLHEFAHGLTCRRFGGEVRDIGFLLVYFQPAFYCNVSDAWLFPEKSKRLWVGFAGPFFELFLWAMAVFIWRVTEADTTIHVAALIVSLSSGVKTLFNFNPFIKLDGYYLLSDILEIPNLRRKAFRFAGALLRKIAGQSAQFPEAATRRERWIFLTYGVIGFGTSITLLCYVLMSALGYFIGGGARAVPAVVVLSFGVLRLRDWFVRLFGRSSKSAADDDDDDDETATSSAKPKAQPRSPSVRAVAVKRWARRLVVATALAVGAVYLARRETDLRVFGAFRALPARSTEVRASVDGIVEEVYVEEGDRVKAGDRIARLSDKDLRAALDRNTAEIREAGANLRMLEAGPSAQEIGVAEVAVQRAEEMVTYAQSRFDLTKYLIEQGVSPRNKLIEIREMTVTSNGSLMEARARLSALRNSVRPEQIEATQAQIERLETERQYTQAQMAMLAISTPVAGIVGTPSLQLKQLRRQYMKKGDPIARINDPGATDAEISVAEKDIGEVRVGQRVDLMVRAYPGVVLHGRVTAIAAALAASPSTDQSLLPASLGSSSSSKSSLLLVRAQMDASPLLLKPDMTGQARVVCGRRKLASLLAWRAARVLNSEFWSWL